MLVSVLPVMLERAGDLSIFLTVFGFALTIVDGVGVAAGATIVDGVGACTICFTGFAIGAVVVSAGAFVAVLVRNGALVVEAKPLVGP